MQTESNVVPPDIARLQKDYRERREQTLLDAAAASLSIHSIINADSIDFDAVTPQMRESFELAFPGKGLNETLSDMASNFDDAQMVSGYMNAWRGKYFEVLVRDRLNDGEHVGDLYLMHGQTAVLAEDLSQPGWDLQIITDDSGAVVTELQLKASESVGYIQGALERYPDIGVLTTDEVADQIASDLVASSGMSNAELSDELGSPLEAVADTPLEDVFEGLLQGLPVLVVAGAEGYMWLSGRQTMERALERSANRLVKTGAAMTAGALVAFAGLGILSAPAAFGTRMGISRYELFARAMRDVRYNIERVRQIGPPASTGKA